MTTASTPSLPVCIHDLLNDVVHTAGKLYVTPCCGLISRLLYMAPFTPLSNHLDSVKYFCDFLLHGMLGMIDIDECPHGIKILKKE